MMEALGIKKSVSSLTLIGFLLSSTILFAEDPNRILTSEEKEKLSSTLNIEIKMAKAELEKNNKELEEVRNKYNADMPRQFRWDHFISRNLILTMAMSVVFPVIITVVSVASMTSAQAHAPINLSNMPGVVALSGVLLTIAGVITAFALHTRSETRTWRFSHLTFENTFSTAKNLVPIEFTDKPLQFFELQILPLQFYDQTEFL
jgi:hypothetical protein